MADNESDNETRRKEVMEAVLISDKYVSRQSKPGKKPENPYSLSGSNLKDNEARRKEVMEAVLISEAYIQRHGKLGKKETLSPTRTFFEQPTEKRDEEWFEQLWATRQGKDVLRKKQPGDLSAWRQFALKPDDPLTWMKSDDPSPWLPSARKPDDPLAWMKLEDSFARLPSARETTDNYAGLKRMQDMDLVARSDDIYRRETFPPLDYGLQRETFSPLDYGLQHEDKFSPTDYGRQALDTMPREIFRDTMPRETFRDREVSYAPSRSLHGMRY